MKSRTYELDMSKGSILKNLIVFTIPLILGNILQLLYNAADIVVVSRWAGSDAMASVGATSSLNALIVNLCIGLSVGSSVVVSQRYGARDYQSLHRAVHSSVVLGLVSGIFAMVVGLFASKPLLILMGTPEGKILDGAVLYTKIFFLGVPGSLVYNFSASVLRGVGDTKHPLYILLISGIINVVLNLIFVIVFGMGVAGVATATAISNYFSAVAGILTLIRADGQYKLFISKLKFYKEELKEILKIGIPAGLQSSVFSIANSVIQSAVNSFGSAAIAGNSAATSIEGFVYTSMEALHQATLTCVSQNYGAKNEKRVKKSVFVAMGCVIVVGLSLGLLTYIFREALLGIYITDSVKAIEYGAVKITIIGTTYFLCGIMNVLAGALRGIGYSTVSTVNSLFGACGFRILWIIFLFPLNSTSFAFLQLCLPLSWIVVIIAHTVAYLAMRNRAFKKIRQV